MIKSLTKYSFHELDYQFQLTEYVTVVNGLKLRCNIICCFNGLTSASPPHSAPADKVL